jgi:hypothetical protein
MSETAEHIQAIDRRFDFLMDKVHTFFPGEIVNVKSSGLIDVQPSVKVLFPGETTPESLSIINNVILWEERSGDAIIRFPKDKLKGAKVGVFITEHSLIEWREKKGVVAFPDEPRRFDINDGVARLGLYPETVPWLTEQKANTLEIQVKEGGKISIGDTNPIPNLNAELLNLFYNFMTNALVGVQDPVSGILPFVNAPKMLEIQNLLGKITNIEVL